MDIDQLISNIDLFKAKVLQAMPGISEEIGLNTIALVKRRLIEEEGIPGKKYSTRPMLATKSQFIVQSAFKQSTVEQTRFHRDKSGKKKAKGGNEKKVVKVKLWIKFKKATKAVPVMELEGGYEEFRKIQGRPVDKINLSYSGKMWQGTTITAQLSQGYTYITLIGGNNKEAQDKLTWMTLKFGQFLTVNDEEQKLLTTIFENRIITLYNSVFKQ